MSSVYVLARPFIASVILAACGGGNAASQVAKAPDYACPEGTQWNGNACLMPLSTAAPSTTASAAPSAYGSTVQEPPFSSITLTPGDGPGAQNGDRVSVHYTGTLLDGTKVDSSLDRGRPFGFTLGADMVIKGWNQGVLGMKVGEKRRIVIPSTLAYGPRGRPGIPPNSTLVFEIELLAINPM